MITPEKIRTAPAETILRDKTLPGLQLYCGKKKKTWYVHFNTNEWLVSPSGIRRRKERRLRIGHYPIISIPAAREMAMEVLLNVAKGSMPDSSKALTLEDIYNEYVKDMASKRSPATIRMHDSLWRVHLSDVLGKREALSIQRKEVAELHRKVGGHQGNRLLSFISGLYSWSEKNEILEAGHNPAKNIDHYKEEPRDRVATPEELSLIGQGIDQSLASGDYLQRQSARLFRALVLTGCRVSEWNKATPEQVCFDEQALTLLESKTGKGTIPIPDALVQTIKDALNETRCNFIFGLSDPGYQWRKLKKEQGLGDLRLHDLRRTYATYAFNSGVSVQDISKMMRHSGTRVTESVYTHFSNERKAEVGDKISGELLERLANQ